METLADKVQRAHSTTLIATLPNNHPYIISSNVWILILCQLHIAWSVFSSNGYPSNTVNSVIKSMTTHSSPTSTTQIQQSQPSTDKPKILVLPFVDGLYRQIERICKPLDIQPVFTSRRTLRSVLMNVKQRPTENKMRGVVYKVDCDCGYYGLAVA